MSRQVRMADFTAGRLERLAASAYDLVANAFLGEPSAMGLQGQKLEPTCTEPFCGGLYWEEGPSWSPDEAPPLREMPKKGGGALEDLMMGMKRKNKCLQEGGPKKHGANKSVKEYMERGGNPAALRAHGHNPNKDAATPDDTSPPKVEAWKRISDDFASRPLDKLDLTGAKVYPPLDKPIATRVKLLPANKDEWPWWMNSRSVKVLLGTNKFGEMDFVLGRKHRNKLLDHLTPFLRLDDDVVVEGKRIPKGSQLLTAKPFRAPLRVAPWIGSREQLKKDVFPLQLTFGAPKNPDFDYSQPQPKDGKGRPIGAPPLERPIEAPVTVPVKRLDVVLKKPREGLKDFLPPLMTAKEPEMETMQDFM